MLTVLFRRRFPITIECAIDQDLPVLDQDLQGFAFLRVVSFDVIHSPTVLGDVMHDPVVQEPVVHSVGVFRPVQTPTND